MIAVPCQLTLVCWVIGGGVADSTTDWTQWGGPTGNFHVAHARLANAWPDSGLRSLWRRPLGDGYSSIVTAGGILFTMYRDGGREFVVALDADTGKTLWEYSYAAPFLPDTNVEEFGPGPLATPLIVGDRLCAVGVTGLFHCLDRKTGQLLWKRDLIGQLLGTNLFRGYSASPAAWQNSVFAPVGGPGRAVVAFRLHDGSIRWQAEDFAISHVAPLLIRVGKQDQLVVVGERVVVGLDPARGERYWLYEHPIRGGYISSTPVWGDDGLLFFSGAYGAGSRCLRLTHDGKATTVRALWHNERMRVHHSTVIRVDDLVFGPSGDFSTVLYSAVDMNTGKVVWRDRSLGRASAVYADGKAIAIQEDGTLVQARLSRDGLKIQARTRLFHGRAWTVPTLVAHRLYVRNRTDIMAFELPGAATTDGRAREGTPPSPAVRNRYSSP